MSPDVAESWTPERGRVVADRIEAVKLLVDVLRTDEPWQDGGDIARRRFAYRVLYVRWLVRTGRISDWRRE